MKTNHEEEQEGISIPDNVDLGEWLLHKAPLPVAYYFRHQFVRYYGLCGCSCCCGHGHGLASSETLVTPASGPTTTPVSVHLDNPMFQIGIFGGSIGAVVNLSWQATGGSGIRVKIMVKRPFFGPAWTEILSNQDPVDVGTWDVSPLIPGERTFHFKAVAVDSAGNEHDSNIQTVSA